MRGVNHGTPAAVIQRAQRKHWRRRVPGGGKCEEGKEKAVGSGGRGGYGKKRKVEKKGVHEGV